MSKVQVEPVGWIWEITVLSGNPPNMKRRSLPSWRYFFLALLCYLFLMSFGGMEVKVDCETLLWNQDICLTCLPLVESVLLQLHCHGNLPLLNLIQPRVCLSALLLQCRQVISNTLILSCIVPKWSGVDITAVLQHLWCCSCAVLWAAQPSCACLQPPLPLSWQSRGSTTCTICLAQQSAKVGTAGNLCLLAVLLPPPCTAAKQSWSGHGPWGESCWRRELCAPQSCGVWGGSQYFCSTHCGVKPPKGWFLAPQDLIKLGAGR